MFVAWQMGIVYFSGNALSIDGRTPLPVSLNNLTMLIVAGYILSIIWLIFLPRLIVRTQRVTAGAAFLSVLALFLPLPPGILALAFYLQYFCCIFLIGFETAVIVNLFRDETAIRHLTLAYAPANLIIALLQNDIAPVPFAVFRFFMAAATAAQLLFYCKLPARVWPRYVKKADVRAAILPSCPRRFFAGIFGLGGVGALITLFGITIAESAPHGISILYAANAFWGVVIFILWKKAGAMPLRTGAVLLGIAVLGFILAVVSLNIPSLFPAACVLLSGGSALCWTVPYTGVILAGRYPSRFISPIFIGMAFFDVLIHTALLEIFRNEKIMLYMVYILIAAGLAVLYFILEPYLLYSFRGRSLLPPGMEITSNGIDEKAGIPAASPERSPGGNPEETLRVLEANAFDRLTGQELRVAELILRGYDYNGIARMLNITANTAQGYRKNLYSKLGIHSIRELFILAERRNRAAEKNTETADIPAKRMLLRRRI
jgi:DNA-binding CsgD family transcriptional regulator